MRASSGAAWGFAFVAAASSAMGQVPMLVSFQGRLTDAGNPVTGNVNLTFGIYDAATSGSLIWTESQVAAVTGGLFTVTLGETSPLSPEVLDGPRWVGVTPAGGSELSPRIRLTSAPHAVRASTALALDGLATPVAQLNQLDGLGPTATGANLNTLTNGSSADALHTHPAVGTAVSTIQTQVSALQDQTTALAADKVSKSGDTMSGVLVASAGVQYADGVTQTAAPSVVFTRWGRTNCPTGTQLTYSGYAASGNYQNSGSGRNMLCMTDSPTWGLFNDGNQNGALLYGVEFETISYGLAGPFPALQDLDGDCAVCLRTPASVTLMVPGTQTCPTGWTQEYAGYLMSTHYTQQGGQFVCVDANPVGRPGSALGANGHLWYPTEAECGSLPCAPYVQDREVTCAVCSR